LEGAAIDALRATARPADAPAISKALSSGSVPQRVGAAAALCRISSQDHRDKLYPLLEDAESRVALEVARSLADVGDRKSLGTLVRLLDAGDNHVRTAAIVTLRGLTGQHMDYAAYETGEARAAAIKKWATWVAGEGQTAKLTFPVPRHSGARGDLAGHTLVTTGSRGQVKQFDPSGKEVFSFPIDAWSAEKLQNGNLLIASYNANKVIEVEPSTSKVVWEHAGINAMKTKPLENGNFLISDFNGHRVVEMARNKQIVWEQPTEQECFDCDRLASGNTIFGCPNFVREVTPDHKLVREWKIDGRLNGFQALPNGNILVANFGRSEVVELAPDGKQIWRLEEPQPCDVFRLPDGNMLVSTQQRIIEVGPDGKVLKVICEAQYGSARR
jgi:outer membrane protein assembly factor BamB